MWLNDLLNNPPPKYQPLVAQTAALVAQLNGARSVALFFDDTVCFTAALLAAWQVGADVFLLPNQQAEAVNWAAQAEILLSDTPIQHKNNILINFNTLLPSHTQPFTFRLPEQSTLFLQTSGSTGTAKIVRKTCAQMCAEAEAVARELPNHWQNLPVLSGISAQHLYGLTFRVFVALKMGWRISGEQCRYPEDFTGLSTQTCVWLSSPTVLSHFGEQRNWARLREHLMGVISAGGMLPEQTIELFEHQLNLPILDIYGSTETGVMARRWGASQHQLFPDVAARLDEHGCLCVRSAWSDGEQVTADSAEILDNTLILHGRNDRIIKLADKRISLHQIEMALMAHDFVADVSCALWQNRVAAWLQLSAAGVAAVRQSGRVAVLAALRQSLVLSIEKVALPRYWRLTADALPRNSQGKLAAAEFNRAFCESPTRPDWQLVAEQENEWHFSGCVPMDLRYFSGHFADFPLVAGVVQLQWAMDLARQFAWGQAAVVQMENVKYQQFIRPNDVVDLTLQWDAGKGKVSFRLMVEGRACSSGRAVLQAA